jgi:hypothetical protein
MRTSFRGARRAKGNVAKEKVMYRIWVMVAVMVALSACHAGFGIR